MKNVIKTAGIAIIFCCIFNQSKAQLFVETPLSASGIVTIDTNDYLRKINSWHLIGIRYYLNENWFFRLGCGGAVVVMNPKYFNKNRGVLYPDFTDTYIRNQDNSAKSPQLVPFIDYGIARVLYRKETFALQLLANHRLQGSTLGALNVAAFNEIENGLYDKAYAGTAKVKAFMEQQFLLKLEAGLLSDKMSLFFALGTGKHFYPTYNFQLNGLGVSGQGQNLSKTWRPESQWLVSASLKLVYRLNFSLKSEKE